MASKGITAIIVVFIVGILIGFGAGYLLAYSPSPQKGSYIQAFAAGSLKLVLGKQFNPAFENITGVKVAMTFAGSLSGVRQAEAGTNFSVFISASAPVLYENLVKKDNYTSWEIVFATNEMAITWKNSKYAISPSWPYWFENLTAKNITVGTSNASLDPSGFQIIETMKLAGILYTNWSNPYVQIAFNHNFSAFMKYNKAWNDWFGKLGYPVNDSLALYHELFISKYLNGTFKLTTVEIGLDSYLASGAIAYALTYKSQAINQNLYYYQNENGQNGLSPWINLGSTNKTICEFYSTINTSGPPWDNVGNLPGAPIFYAVTILKNYMNQQAIQYVYALITNMGKSYLSANGFDPLTQPFYVGTNIPSMLMPLVVPAPGYLPVSSYE